MNSLIKTANKELELAHTYLQEGNLNDAQNIIIKAIQKYEGTENSPLDKKLMAAKLLAKIYREQKDLSSSEKELKKAIDSFDKIDDSKIDLLLADIIFSIYYDIANIYYEQNSFSIAIDYYKKAEKTAEFFDKEDKNFINRLANLYLSVGIAFQEAKQYDNAEKYYKNAVASYRKSNNSDGEKNASTKIYELYNYTGKSYNYLQIIEAEKTQQAQKIGDLQEQKSRALNLIIEKNNKITELEKQKKQSQKPEEIRPLEVQIQALQSEKEVLYLQTNTLQSQLTEAYQKQNNLVSQIQDLEAKLAFAEQQLEALRQKYKEIDFSQNSDAYKQAYELLLEGKTNKADQVLNHSYLEEKEHKIRQQTKENYRSLANDYIIAAQIHEIKSDFTQAHQSYQQAITLCPDAEFWFAYASFLQKLNYFDQAILYYQKALEQYRKEDNLPYVATTLNNLANLQYAQNEFADALSNYQEALKIYRELAKENPRSYLPYVATTLNNLANLQKAKNEFADALSNFQEALQIYQDLAKENLKSYLPDLAQTLNNLANLQKAKNEFADALANYQEALKIYRELAKENPKSYLLDLAQTLNNLGELYRINNQFDEALQNFQEALQIRRELAKENPRSYLPYVATTLNNLANLQKAKNEFAEALGNYEEALKIYRELANENPRSYLPDVAMTLNNLAVLQKAKNEFADALSNFQEALQIRRELANENPRTYKPDVATTLNNLAVLQKDKNEFADALSNFQEALKIQRELANENPRTYLPYVATTLNNLANLQSAKNELADALSNYQEALKIYRELAKENALAFDLDYCSTALNICMLFTEFVQQGLLQYVAQANELLEDVAFRLRQYPNIPQAQHYKETGLIPLSQFFGQHKGHIIHSPNPTKEVQKKLTPIELWQKAQASQDRKETIALFSEYIEHSQKIPFSQNEDKDLLAEAYLRRGVCYGKANQEISVTPALQDFEKAFELLKAQLEDDTTWALLLENAYWHYKELDKESVKGLMSHFFGKATHNKIQAIKARTLELLEGKSLTEDAQAWKEKLSQ